MSHRQTPSRTTLLFAACGLAACPFALPAFAQGPLWDPFPAELGLAELDGAVGFALHGAVAGGNAGFGIASAGDVNGDGVDDVVVGAVGAGAGGSAYVVFGVAGGPGSGAPAIDLADLDGTNGFRIDGAQAGDGAGYSVAPAGDVNGDGLADVIIGTPFAQGGLGGAAVVFGRAGGFPAAVSLADLDGTNGFAFVGGNIGGGRDQDRAGASVASAGDFNGDGFDDVMIGAPRAYGVSGTGEVYVVFGHGDGFDAALTTADLSGDTGLVMYGGNWAMEVRMGQSIAPVGDVNGDGIDDVVLGTPGVSSLPEFFPGTAYIVFGRREAFPRTMVIDHRRPGAGVVELLGIADGDMFGSSVASAGDVNGDGVGDLLVGAQRAGGSGEAYVVFGRGPGDPAFPERVEMASLGGFAGFALRGGAAFTGISVAGPGDVTGDGVDDLVVGAELMEGHGGAYVLYGHADGFPASVSLADLEGLGFVIAGLDDDDQAGFSVGAAGDLNGDGVGDVAVGAPSADPGGRADAGEGYVVYGRVFDGCPADLDGDGEMTIFDFLAFQNLFDAGDPRADFDGDGTLTLFDFLAFQNAFDAGCD